MSQMDADKYSDYVYPIACGSADCAEALCHTAELTATRTADVTDRHRHGTKNPICVHLRPSAATPVVPRPKPYLRPSASICGSPPTVPSVPYGMGAGSRVKR